MPICSIPPGECLGTCQIRPCRPGVRWESWSSTLTVTLTKSIGWDLKNHYYCILANYRSTSHFVFKSSLSPLPRPCSNCWAWDSHGWWPQHRENRWGPGEGSCCRLQGLIRQRCIPWGIPPKALHDCARSWVHWACKYLMSLLNILHLIFFICSLLVNNYRSNSPLLRPFLFHASQQAYWFYSLTHLFLRFLQYQVTPQKIAEYTIRTLERTVPPSVPGITFLSGGLSEEEASIYLNTMNQIKRKGPWSVTFSYGRALQQSTLKTWGGKAENIPAAQRALLARAQANSEANLGKYIAGSQPSADGTLFVKGYKY